MNARSATRAAPEDEAEALGLPKCLCYLSQLWSRICRSRQGRGRLGTVPVRLR
jgi:hypothetical protein